MNTKQTLDQFISELVDKDTDILTMEQKAALKLEVLNELEKRLKVVSLENLNESDLSEFAEAAASGVFDLVDQVKFFTEHIPNYEQIMQQALADFKKEFTSLVI